MSNTVSCISAGRSDNCILGFSSRDSSGTGSIGLDDCGRSLDATPPSSPRLSLVRSAVNLNDFHGTSASAALTDLERCAAYVTVEGGHGGRSRSIMTSFLRLKSSS